LCRDGAYDTKYVDVMVLEVFGRARIVAVSA
jgi:hypothetical protein